MSKAKDSSKTGKSVQNETPSGPGGESVNPAVDATRVRLSESDKGEGEVLTASNAADLLTDNEVSERNREVANLGTEHEGDNKTDVAKNFNR